MKTTVREEWALAALVESGYEGPLYKTVTLGYSVSVMDERFDRPFERERRTFETRAEAERYASRFA
jgi:hypothetical protein